MTVIRLIGKREAIPKLGEDYRRWAAIEFVLSLVALLLGWAFIILFGATCYDYIRTESKSVGYTLMASGFESLFFYFVPES